MGRLNYGQYIFDRKVKSFSETKTEILPVQQQNYPDFLQDSKKLIKGLKILQTFCLNRNS